MHVHVREGVVFVQTFVYSPSNLLIRAGALRYVFMNTSRGKRLLSSTRLVFLLADVFRPFASGAETFGVALGAPCVIHVVVAYSRGPYTGMHMHTSSAVQRRREFY